MNFLPTSLCALVLALILPSGMQGGAGKPTAPQAPKEAPKERKAALSEILGVWRLVEFEAPNLRPQKRVQVGYLLIADDFLSFECHIGWNDGDGSREATTFFTGTHEYDLRDDGVLELTQLIGTTMDPTGPTPVFDPVGRKRQYKVKSKGALLVLERQSDAQRFTFERHAASGQGGLDFYGRRKPPEKPATPPAGGEQEPK